MSIPFGQVECGECGMPYCPTRDGRWNHQHIFGHPAVPAVEKTVEQQWSEATERAFSQVKAYNGGKKTAPVECANTDEGLTTTTLEES